MLLICVCAAPSCSGSQARIVYDSVSDYRDSMTCVTPILPDIPSHSESVQVGARLSRASAGSEHAQKLFFLYANDPDAYESAVRGMQQAHIGLTLVMESHHVLSTSIGAHGPAGTKIVYQPGTISGLFIMMKVGESETPETDMGWVYATATPHGKIESVGLIESCIKCHQSAEHDRLFGL